MKANLKTIVIVTALAAVGFGLAAQAAPATKDPTKYDCREIVGYKRGLRGGKVPTATPILACLHKDKMAAGKCETHWLFGMRCKE